MQVATSPKLVAVAVESGSVTRGLIETGGSFSVSLLARSDRALVRRFVKPVRDVETDDHGVAAVLQGEPVVEVAGGLPRAARRGGLAGLRGAFGVGLGRAGPAGPAPASHVLVVGEVMDAGASDRLGGPRTGRRRPGDGGHPHELRRLTGGAARPRRPPGRSVR